MTVSSLCYPKSSSHYPPGSLHLVRVKSVYLMQIWPPVVRHSVSIDDRDVHTAFVGHSRRYWRQKLFVDGPLSLAVATGVSLM
jgi:hypothetical protein